MAYLGRDLGLSLIHISSYTGKGAFEKVKALLKTRRIRFETRNGFARRFIWSVVLYSSETQTIKKKVERHLESFEMLV